MSELIRFACLAAVAAAVAPSASFAQRRDFSGVEIEALPIRDNVFMLVGAGGNITVQLGADGVLLVDTQFAPLSDRILASIRALTPQPLRYIVNTHHHGDHTGGNANLRAAGSTVSGGNMAGAIADSAVGAAIVAHENVLTRLSADEGPQALPAGGWPTSTFFGAKKELYYNGEGIEIIHVPAAHTDGDSIVFFRRSDVIAAGDVFSTNGYPFIDIGSGGSYAGLVRAVEKLVDIIIPVYGQDGGTLVVPGHGRVANLGDVLNYREMLIVVGDRVRSMLESGLTLEQVKGARPTADYDPVYGEQQGSAERFIEAVYESLDAERARP